LGWSSKKGRVMSTIPEITEQDIRRFIDAQSFLRGQNYFNNGAIFDAQRQGMILKGRCQGSRSLAYTVEVTFGDQDILDNDCSCPLGSYCKHVAALLLTWVHRPQEFIEQPEYDKLLEQYGKEELISLIKKMLRREPDLETLLSTVSKPQEPVNPQIYQRQIDSILRRAGHEWGAANEIVDEFNSIKVTADDFVEQGAYANAVTIYEVVVHAMLDNLYNYEDALEQGSFHELVGECIDQLSVCLDEVKDDQALRERILQLLFDVYKFDVEGGGISLGEESPGIMLEHSIAEERRVIARWVRKAIATTAKGESDWSSKYHQQWYGGFLLELEADTLDDEAYLRICRETGRIGDAVDRLLVLGRVDEAIKEAQQVSDYDLMAIADIFVQQSHDALAETLIKQRAPTSSDTRLLEWLKKYYLSRNDKAKGLEIAVDLFNKQQPVLAYYQEIRLLAKMLNRWDSLRPLLIAQLKEAKQTYLLIQIALDENDVEEALVLLKTSQAQGNAGSYSYSYFYGGSGIDIEVARAAEEKMPRESIEIYQNRIDKLINQRGRGSYQQAAQYLLRVRELFNNLDESEQWTTYITSLREKNRPLRALKEELLAAGLI
jgi:uncharacterized Zn finger protein